MENTAFWTDMKLRELRRGDNVATTDAAIPKQQIPPWFDSKKFYRAKALYREHFLSFTYSGMVGLLLVFYFPKILKVLLSTGESKTKKSTFHRYLQTIRHVQKWYEGDIFDDNDPAHKSLFTVRNMHFKAGKNMSLLNDGIVYVTQWDMAIVQWAFIAPIIIFKSLIGFHGLQREDYEAIVHFWRIIGYFLGIGDQYNLCDGEYYQVDSICKALLNEEYKIQLAAMDSSSVNLGRNVASVLQVIFPLFTYNSMSAYIHDLMNLPCPEKMNLLDWLCFYFTRFLLRALMKYSWLRTFWNNFLRWRLNVADKKDAKLMLIAQMKEKRT